MIYIYTVLCVIGIAIGQMLFKASSTLLSEAGTLFSLRVLFPLGSAVALYGVTTIAWVWILQNAQLGKIYPLMALSFVFVPIGSYIFFDERFSLQYVIGIALIICGIVISVIK